MPGHRLDNIGPEYMAFETITVSTVAIGFTAATMKDYTHAIVSIESQALRYRLDGTAPTSTVGHPMAAATELRLTSNHQLRKIKFIRSGGADATLQVSYGR